MVGFPCTGQRTITVMSAPDESGCIAVSSRMVGTEIARGGKVGVSVRSVADRQLQPLRDRRPDERRCRSRGQQRGVGHRLRVKDDPDTRPRHYAKSGTLARRVMEHP